jgi:three-Cys-motif partner protein
MAADKIDPSDGLIASKAQEWAEEKHSYLRKFLGASSATRRKWLEQWGGATYSELFCGPGRSYVQGTSRFIDGSPLVAHREATRTRTNFSAIHLADDNPTYCETVEKRLQALGAKPIIHNLKSEAAARRIAKALPADALNVAFLDPYNLGDLPLTIFETFAPLPHIDLIVHVSAMDLARALPTSMKAESAPLDRFAPGWREAVAGLPPKAEARGKIIEHWLGLVRALGFKDARVWNLIRGKNRQPLYWLLLVAKHPLAGQFWDDISKSKQGGLFTE